jgi:hypothetical protein
VRGDLESEEAKRVHVVHAAAGIRFPRRPTQRTPYPRDIVERAPAVTALDEKLELLTRLTGDARAGSRQALNHGVIAEHAPLTRLAVLVLLFP